VASIDLVRGLAIVFMALDHVRDFICNIPFPAEDIRRTWTFYFLVRWVTHFCAPAFFLLTGAGAYLYGLRRTPWELQKFLLIRGCWLIFLNLTVISFAWTFVAPFTPPFVPTIAPTWGILGVIFSLGASMILLAAMVRLPRYVNLTLAITVLATFGLFDRVWQNHSYSSSQYSALLLFALFGAGRMAVGHETFTVLFPLIPWSAVTLLGFSLGSLFKRQTERSRWPLLLGGTTALVLFVLLRSTNLYGNPPGGVAQSSPGDWRIMPTFAKTLILFVDVEKYPPSLDFLLMTLGPILILLAVGGATEWGAAGRVLKTYGRVPLFFYILHIFTIHLAAVAIGLATHQQVDWLLHGGFFLNHPPAAQYYGHGLGVVCVTWVIVVAVLYWPCAQFAELKNRHPGSLLRFL
jgi:uncharacterized membrane protein